ncbi:flagellar basal-body rod protein FlgF [Janthinobacterium agaricidamnosum]|uniref:Flagellar basal-body rod protein FlgF n=1 Tax=Janthinobacterium agaricidamnosum NBRC 102515 = DSM 9628 TaxID=1349767 RepID=W0UZ87_9BURK|nr:flagellar basal-body rod protein FlgF [Janthinobacterium agaricidamnosum]CDG81879.1 flagellar basal-body rod protein FlgF [Janthinobacterium agaricidamnosum NBRC 102515 = DSM 9628]
MDRLIYTALSGAKHVLEQQATTANNLANASSTGFRAQLDSFRAVPVVYDGLPTRAFVSDTTVGSNFAQGPIQQTGRPLDVALQNQGWIVVQAPDGTEAYTRNGSLKINENGVLQTQNGLTVQGDTGPLSVPPDVTVAIATDGTIGTLSTDPQPGPAIVLGRIKLVNPPEQSLVRGDDGLFRLKDGSAAPADPNVKLASGALEGSNVNPVDAMVSMISLGRQFETQMSLLKNAENNAAKATQILALN